MDQGQVFVYPGNEYPRGENAVMCESEAVNVDVTQVQWIAVLTGIASRRGRMTRFEHVEVNVGQNLMTYNFCRS